MTEIVNDDSFESFGQSERLIDRLKDLIKGYGDGLDVFKELIQNSDDAGATVIKICLDLRPNKEWNKSLFSPQLAEVQGDAFWFYNNAEFTENDFESIVRLGGRHKSKKSGVIGKFGLGFNAVYNITDLPSIMSGEKIAIFDPNLKYLAKQIKDQSKPGVLINLNAKKSNMKNYVDQFKPYRGIFGCNYIENNVISKNNFNFKGTLFRFPFRKSPSEISETLYTKERAKNILEILFENAEKLLMFTQNICKLELYTLETDNKQMVSICSIEKSSVKFIRKHDVEFHTTSLCDLENKELIKQSSFLKLSGHLIEQNQTNIEKTSIFTQKIELTTSTSKLFPNLESKTENTYWFQALNCFQCPNELKKDEQFKKMLPCTAVSFKLVPEDNQSNQMKLILNKDNKNNGSIFCFLPLPARSFLSFIVNANFFLTSTREDIIYSSKDRIDAFESIWNDNLQQCLAETLIKCCTHMINAVDYDIKDLMNLWPVNTKMQILENEFYKKIFDYSSEIRIFNHKQTAYSISKCKVLKLSFTDEMIDLAKCLLQTIIGDEYLVIVIPENIRNYLDSNEIVIRNEVKDTEFCKLFIENIEKIANADGFVNVINYLLRNFACEKDGTLTEIGLLFKNNKCLPTNITRSFKKPNELVNKKSILNELFDEKLDDVFPIDEIFIANEQVLVKIGLITDYLPLKMILERIKIFISKNENKFDCWQLVNQVMNTLINKTEHNCDAHNLRNEIFMQKFLKAKKCEDKNLHLIWYSDVNENNLWSLNDLYSEKSENLIFRVKPIFDSSKLNPINRESINILKLKELDVSKAIEQFKALHKDWLESDEDKKSILGFQLYEYFYRFLSWLHETYLKSNLDLSELNLSTNFLFFNFNEKFEYFNIEDVAFTVKHASSCHLIQLPNELHRFKKTLLKLGVKEYLSTDFLIEKMSEVYEKYKNERIDDSVVDLCLNIVKELDFVGDLKMFRDKIFLPNQDMMLKKSTDLFFQDEQSKWLSANHDNIVNEKVPLNLAKNLEILKLQTHAVKGLLQGFSFGQKEPLVARIKKLLESYPNFFDTFKELIQNADDAGASKISFILDTRIHGSTKIMTNELAALQGPALLCYNNKIFSEDDFTALKTLGVGNKGEEKFKVGKYGVGFNTVYRLTDAPQLISNFDNWVLFDPLCKHFPDLSDSNPGYRIKFDGNSPLNQYTDFLESFKGDFETLNELENGTMLRFALRKEKSDISDTVLSPDAIEMEFKKNENELKNSMIFLRNIQNLNFKKIKANGEVEIIFEYERQFPTEKDQNEYSEFIKYFKESSKRQVMQIGKRVFNYNCRISNSKTEYTNFLIISQIGFERKVNFTESRKYFPVGAIALPIEEQKDFKAFLYCFLPLPIPVSTPYHINGYFALNNESRQGLCKLTDNDNEKFKWNQCIFNDIISSLMIQALYYLKEAFSKRYADNANLLEKEYLKFFPPLKLDNKLFDLNVYMDDMVQTFYKKFFECNLSFLPIFKQNSLNDSEWCTYKSSNLYSSNSIKKWSYRQDDSNIFMTLCDILIQYGFKICKFYDLIAHLNKINTKVNSYQAPIRDLNGEHVLDYFKKNVQEEIYLNQTNFINEANLVELLKFCLHNNKRSCLDSHPFDRAYLLLDASNKLRMFNSNKKLFEDDEHEIFSSCLEKFMHPSFAELDLDLFTSEISLKDLKKLLPYALDEVTYFIKSENMFKFKMFPEICEETVKIFEKVWSIINKSIEANNEIIEDKGDQLKKLALLSNWAIIPIRFSNNEKIFAAPIGCLSLILFENNEKENMRTELKSVFDSLNLPFLAISHIQLLNSIAVNLKTVALDEVLNICDQIDIVTNLDTIARKRFLEYLVSSSSNDDNNNNSILRIKSLPLFENIFGEMMSIRNKTAIIMKRVNIPLDGLQEIFSSKKYYLAWNEHSDSFYEDLELDVYDFNSFYGTYLGHLNRMNYEDKKTHIFAIEKHSKLQGLDSSLIHQLESFSFIKASNGCLRTAEEFYNPNVRFFQIIYKNCNDIFPTEPYCGDTWISFLCKIGLQDLKIVNDSSKINEYFNLAQQNFNSINNDEYYYVISQLYNSISSLYTNRTFSILNSFKISVKFLIEKLSNEDLYEILDKIKPIFITIYTILNKIKSKSYLEDIKNEKLVLHEIETNDKITWRLSSIEKFVENDLRKSQEIDEYLYRFPDYLYDYRNLFLSMGLHQHLSYELCAKMLENLKINENADSSIIAFRIMDLLFSAEFTPDDSTDLYLLNNNLKLVKSSELYYIDRESLYHLYETEFCKDICIVSLKTLSSKFKRYELYSNKWESLISTRLLSKHQPKPISREITYSMKHNSSNDSIIDIETTKKIQGASFIKSIKRLLKTDSESIDDFFRNAKCFKTVELVSQICFKGEPIPDSEHYEISTTNFDDSKKSIIFYRNTMLPYVVSKFLCDGIVEGLERYFHENKEKINHSTAETIIELLLADKEEIYENILEEDQKFKITKKRMNEMAENDLPIKKSKR